MTNIFFIIIIHLLITNFTDLTKVETVSCYCLLRSTPKTVTDKGYSKFKLILQQNKTYKFFMYHSHSKKQMKNEQYARKSTHQGVWSISNDTLELYNANKSVMWGAYLIFKNNLIRMAWNEEKEVFNFLNKEVTLKKVSCNTFHHDEN